MRSSLRRGASRRCGPPSGDRTELTAARRPREPAPRAFDARGPDALPGRTRAPRARTTRGAACARPQRIRSQSGGAVGQASLHRVNGRRAVRPRAFRRRADRCPLRRRRPLRRAPAPPSRSPRPRPGRSRPHRHHRCSVGIRRNRRAPTSRTHPAIRGNTRWRSVERTRGTTSRPAVSSPVRTCIRHGARRSGSARSEPPCRRRAPDIPPGRRSRSRTARSCPLRRARRRNPRCQARAAVRRSTRHDPASSRPPAHTRARGPTRAQDR
jgi:hypothetical protein